MLVEWIKSWRGKLTWACAEVFMAKCCRRERWWIGTKVAGKLTMMTAANDKFTNISLKAHLYNITVLCLACINLTALRSNTSVFSYICKCAGQQFESIQCIKADCKPGVIWPINFKKIRSIFFILELGKANFVENFLIFKEKRVKSDFVRWVWNV